LECEEDKVQHNPVSVLNSPFKDEVLDEEVASSSNQSLANVERTKQRLQKSIQWLESLDGVDEKSSWHNGWFRNRRSRGGRNGRISRNSREECN